MNYSHLHSRQALSNRQPSAALPANPRRAPRQIHHPETQPWSRTAIAQGPPGSVHCLRNDVQTLPSLELRFQQISTFYWSIIHRQDSPQITGTILDFQKVRSTPSPAPPDKETQSRQRLGDLQAHLPQVSSLRPRGWPLSSFLHFLFFFFYRLLHFIQETIHHVVYVLAIGSTGFENVTCCSLHTGDWTPPIPPPPLARASPTAQILEEQTPGSSGDHL